MKYQLRDYQQQAVGAAVNFFTSPTKANAIMVLPTGAGKSLVLANIALLLNAPVLIFQPGREILQQNYEKLLSYGFDEAGIFSASFGRREIKMVTFATIGSVKNYKEYFSQFKYVLVDECFPYQQRISTERGQMKIGHLYNLSNEGKELPKVLSYNEETKELEPNRIVSVRCTGRKNIIKLKFNAPLYIKTTANHPFLTLEGWKSSNELSIGEAVLSTHPDGRFLKIPNNDQVDFLLGSLVGDGSLYKSRKVLNANRFRFIQGEAQGEYLKWKAWMLGCSDKVRRIEHNGFSDKPAYRFSSEVIYIKDSICTKKYAIDNLTPKSLAVIYMDDGHLDSTQCGATICSVAESEELTNLLVQKMQSWGIDCIPRKSKSSLTGKTYNYIGLRRNGVEKLCELIAPYIHPSMKYKLIDKYKDLAGTYNWDNSYSKFGCAIFLGKESAGSETVYNMEVENAHTYVVTKIRYDKNQKTFSNGFIVHNCHLCNPEQGMYKDFFDTIKCKILGVTATPYRLYSSQFMGSMLKFITRTRPRIFSQVIYHVQVGELLRRGYLAPLNYYSLNVVDTSQLPLNTLGSDYSEEALRKYYEEIKYNDTLENIVRRLLVAGRQSILVFTRFVEEANALAKILGADIAKTVSADMSKQDRARILENFKAGRVKVVVNVGILTTGFDFPALSTIVLARPTMSLALYYQMCLDMETEVLTQRGFLKHSQITYDDKAAAWENGEIKWVEIQNITYRDTYPGERFVSYKNPHLNFRVTEEHDLLVSHRNKESYFKDKAINTAQRASSVRLPVSGIMHSEGAPLTDDEIRFIGYMLSDGSVSKHTHAIQIVQSLRYPDVLKNIEDTIQRCNFRYGKTLQKRKGDELKYYDTYHFTISYGMPRRVSDRDRGLTGWSRLEKYIKGCKTWSDAFEEFNEHQFDVLLSAINEGDGNKHIPIDYNRQTMTICMGINKDYVDKMQSLALRRGYRCNLSVETSNRKNPLYMLHLKKTTHSSLNGQGTKGFERNGYFSPRAKCQIEEPQGVEKVWCITNHIGTIVTRRNGKVLIMGNCGRAIRPYNGKVGWVVDLCGNVKRFGKVDQLYLHDTGNGKWAVFSGQKQLTNVFFD